SLEEFGHLHPIIEVEEYFVIPICSDNLAQRGVRIRPEIDKVRSIQLSNHADDWGWIGLFQVEIKRDPSARHLDNFTKGWNAGSREFRIKPGSCIQLLHFGKCL